MTSRLPTVLDKFWTRVYSDSEARALVLRNNEDVRNVLLQSGARVWQNEYVPLNVGAMGKAVAVVAAFLNGRGIKKGDRVSLCGWNSPSWVIVDLAIQSLGAITTPIFPTTTEAGVQYIINNSGARLLLSDDPSVLAKAPAGCEKVLYDDIPQLLTGKQSEVKLPFAQRFLSESTLALHDGLRCEVKNAYAHFESLLRSREGLGITLDQLATIVYTSGTTGVPKGVMISHGNLAYECDGMVRHGFELDPLTDLYLSYLPLSHIYERAAGMMLCMWTGVPMAFTRPFPEELSKALKDLHPELFHAVPAIWRKMCENIEAGLALRTMPFDKWLGQYAAQEGKKSLVDLNKAWLAYDAQARLIAWARKQQRGTLGGKIADRLVLHKIRQELGGDLRLCTSGGGAISKELLQYFHDIGVEVLQGYGMTETTGALTVNRPDGCGEDVCNQYGAAGTLISVQGLQMRIADLPGWEGTGQGEIQVKGPTVMVGYWQMPEETAKTFTADGWLRTGDIGFINEHKFLVITDRLKDMMKTDGGKFVAPAKVMKSFDQHPIVQCIVPVGDGMPFFSGLIFVNQVLARQILMRQADEIKPENLADPAFIARHPLIIDAVQQAVNQANTQLEPWETIKKFRIVEVEATTESGLLTDLKKPRSAEIKKRYKALIDEMYAKPKA